MKYFKLLLMGLMIATSAAFTQYTDYPSLEKKMREISAKHASLNLDIIAKTDGDKNIYVLTAGNEKKTDKPGIAIIGGVEGYTIASRELLVNIAEKIAVEDSEILNKVNFYIIPDITPDASSQYFSKIKYERRENARSYDDDRDGKSDEDGFDDLNNDGLITSMRVTDDAKGEWIEHPDFPSIMIKADRSKNEKGKYILLKEGVDNDKDGLLNEDGPGGIILNKNFSFNYQNFEKGAGENPFSETESRALADFLFNKWNIFAVVFIGPENNLSAYDDLSVSLNDKAIPSKISGSDKTYFDQIINSYNSNVKLNDKSKKSPEGGSLLSWTYFHYYRFAFSTPAWNVPSNKESKSAESDYMKWAQENGISNTSLNWEEVDHPDFPGMKVEIGGIKPYGIHNPPFEALDSITSQHYDFLLDLASLRPAIELRIISTEKKSGDLFEMKVEIINSGSLPLMTKMAERSKWIKKLRIDLNTSSSQEIIGGKKVNLVNQLLPGESKELYWLIKGKGELSIKAGSPQTDFVEKIVNLK